MQIQACLTPQPRPLTHTTLMRTRALGTPAPGPGSADGSEKRELREPEGEHRAIRQSHPSTPTRAPAGPRGHT